VNPVVGSRWSPRPCRAQSYRVSRPVFNARIALALKAPKLMAEMLNTLAEYRLRSTFTDSDTEIVRGNFGRSY